MTGCIAFDEAESQKDSVCSIKMLPNKSVYYNYQVGGERLGNYHRMNTGT